MQKLLNKKLLGKKGFTLAELLVVIAILAILIAIAVPVFTHMVAEANLRVNQANVHSVRSAAVAHILTHLGEPDDRTLGGPVKLNAYMNQPYHAWVAVAQVDNNGNISNLKVYAYSDIRTNGYEEGISLLRKSGAGMDTYTSTDKTNNNFFPLSDDVKSPFATVKPSMSENDPKVYYVQAIVTDLKTDES